VGLRILNKVRNKDRQPQHILPIGRKKYNPKQRGSEKNVKTEFTALHILRNRQTAPLQNFLNKSGQFRFQK